MRSACALLLIVGSTLLAPFGAAHGRQDPPVRPARKPLAIKGAKVYPVSAPPIEGAVILLDGTRIKAIGKDVQIPGDATVIDATGRVIIPGLVDAGSSVLVPRGDSGTSGSAEHDVADGVDTFSEEDKEVLQSGVTTALVRPLARGQFNGLEAVLRLLPNRDPQRFYLRRAAALKMTLGFSGADTSTAQQRQQDLLAARQSFEGAKAYKETWDKYRKDLAEYEQKKKQWDEQQKKTPPKADPPKADPPKADPPKPDPSKPAAPEPLKEEPKKPAKPRVDPRSEVLVRALDGQLTVHIEAHAADSIEHALALAAEFKLKIVLEGATEAHLVAEAIAKAKVAVILGPVFRYGIPKVDYVNHAMDCAAVLAQANVEFAIGSFPNPAAGHSGSGASRFLLEAAACAVAHGVAPERALRAVTLDAAKLAGVDRAVGSLEPNKAADLVILTAEPFDSAARVDRVILAGEVVYERKSD